MELRAYTPPDELPSGPLTVRQVIETYQRLGEEGDSPEALAERARIREAFVRALGDRLVSSCRGAELLLFLRVNPAWKSDWTRLRVIGTIQRCFNWAAEFDLITKNPFRAVQGRQGERGRHATDAEYRALLRATDAAFRRFLLFMRITLARPGEIRALEWSHLDLERACAVLQRHKTRRSRKDHAPRKITLSPVAVKLLLWIRQHRHHERFIFVNSRGRPWTKSAVDLRIYQLRKRLGLAKDCKLYSVRHLGATSAAKHGTDAFTLAELLGHTTPAMAAYYVHLAGETDHLQEAVAKAGKPLRN